MSVDGKRIDRFLGPMVLGNHPVTRNAAERERAEMEWRGTAPTMDTRQMRFWHEAR